MVASYKKRPPSLYLLKSNSSAQFMPLQEFELQSKAERAGSAGGVSEDTEAQITAESTNGRYRYLLKTFPDRLHTKRALLLIMALMSSWLVVGYSVLHFGSSSLPVPHKAFDSRRSFSIENVLRGDFSYYDYPLTFLKSGAQYQSQDHDPGLYIALEDENGIPKYVAKQLLDDEYYVELGLTTFKHRNIQYQIDDFQASHRLDKAILATNVEKRYRHSSSALYWLKDVPTNTYKPISPFPGDEKLYKLSFARFSPARNFVYFVYENDLYLQSISNSQTVIRLTSDGSENIFNGKPDWVYEEEVLASDQAVWWAPDDSKFIFARFDDSEVQTERLPTYINDEVYDTFEDVHYPKPGTPNPRFQLFSYVVNQGVLAALPQEDDTAGRILYSVQWLEADHFMVKETDRSSQIMSVKMYDLKSNMGSTVRTTNATRWSGWIEKVQSAQVIPPKESEGRNDVGYVDIEVDDNGFPHIFYFPSVMSKTGVQLTAGPWEVTGLGIVGYDYDTDVVMFLANKMGRFSQHLFSVSVSDQPDGAIHALQNPDEPDAYYEFDLSLSCRFGVKRYLGPNAPMSDAGTLTSLLQNDESRAILQLTSQKSLLDALDKYSIPKTVAHQLDLGDGVQIDFKETLPEGFDPDAKHPLLVHVYGGPGSQTVDNRFSISLEESLSSTENAIVLSIEPRGTGGKGWWYRSWAKDKIGFWEPRDILSVVKLYIATHPKRVDIDRVAIWGWSYGGFVTLKTLELDHGETFKYGVAVAPVTDWRFYNSIYTERYMGKIEENEKGYKDTSLIKDFGNFSHVERFLLIHGSADDNVHFKNTMRLVDELNLHNVRNYDLSVFPDSEHSIVFHNAGQIVYERIFHWLKNAFEGKFDDVDW